MPAAGWYPNPDGLGGMRYWDGTAWTPYATAPPTFAPLAARTMAGSVAAMPKAGSAATGPLPLHPMTVSDLLDGIFKLLKANFRTIAIIVGTLIIPLRILLAFLERGTLGGESVLSVINDPSLAGATHSSAAATVLRLAVELVDILMLPFIGGAIAIVVAHSYLGEEIGPGEALRATGRKFRSLFGAWWIHLGGELVGVLCCFVGIFPAIALFALTAPAIVTEQLSAWKGIQRSWRLVARRFWPTLGIILLVGLMTFVLGSILGTVPDILAFAIGLRWGWLLLALGGSVSALIVTPIAAITATLLYFDARIRTEGFDLQVMAAGLDRPRS